MPNYKFKCLECGHEFQKLLPPSHEAQKCLECGHPESQKILEAPGVHFKGSGFYATDSKKTGEKVEKTEPKAAPAESKTDTK